MEPLDRSEWTKIYDERDPLLKARLLRANARNPRIRTIYLIQGLNSEDSGDSQKAITNAVNNVKKSVSYRCPEKLPDLFCSNQSLIVHVDSV